MAQSELNGVVEPVCKSLCIRMNYEFVDVELVKEGAGRYLRIYISKPDGITLDDCEAFHRAVQPKLEHVDYDFLEVCSPGLDRPFKRAQDYERHVREDVEVHLYKGVEGKKYFEGALAGLEDGVVTIDTPEGSRAFALSNISLARPLILVDEEDLGADDDAQE